MLGDTKLVIGVLIEPVAASIDEVRSHWLKASQQKLCADQSPLTLRLVSCELSEMVDPDSVHHRPRHRRPQRSDLCLSDLDPIPFLPA